MSSSTRLIVSLPRSLSRTTVFPAASVLPSASRLYHSYEHGPPPSPYSPAETAILSAALEHVPTHGFTETSLAMGARQAGYLDITTNLLPSGVFDLVKFHLVSERRRLADSAAESLTDSMGVSQKIRALCQLRLQANEPVIHRWQEALAVMSLAGNLAGSVKELGNLADEIWFLAGDRSADMSWYSKRLLLGGVYASTELFMTQDKSVDFNHTWSFLDRRLRDVNTFGTASRGVGQFMDYSAHNLVNVLRSKGMRI